MSHDTYALGAPLRADAPVIALPPITPATMARHGLLAILARVVHLLSAERNASSPQARLRGDVVTAAYDACRGRYSNLPARAATLDGASYAHAALEDEERALYLVALAAFDRVCTLEIQGADFTTAQLCDLVESAELAHGPRLAFTLTGDQYVLNDMGLSARWRRVEGPVTP